MNPLEFLSLAERLQKETGEAEWRTSAGRAYYSAFHCSCDFVAACGIKLPRSAAAHDKVAHCLRNCDDETLASAGAQLSSLRTTRNAADYDLSSRWFANAKAVEGFLSIAKAVISTVDAAQGRQDIRSKMRTYARDIVGLPVIGLD